MTNYSPDNFLFWVRNTVFLFLAVMVEVGASLSKLCGGMISLYGVLPLYIVYLLLIK